VTVAHTAEEHVSVGGLERAVSDYARLVKALIAEAS
jgi:hypothetical protein